MPSSNAVELAGTPPPPNTEPERPLLPDFLLRPGSLLWLWLAPIAVLLLLNLQGYRLIEGNMDDAQRALAHQLGWAGLADFFGGIGILVGSWLSARRRLKNERPALVWALAAVAVQTAYLWFAAASTDKVLPTSVRAWLYPETHYLFNQFAFAMLPLFWGILRLAAAIPGTSLGRTFVASLGLSLGAPLVLYVGMNFFSRLLRFWQIPAMLVAAGVVILGILMFVGLSRALLIGLRAGQTLGPWAERTAIWLVALVFPVCGLLLNRTIPFPTDLQAWEVYALVLANTGILLLASYKHAAWPRGSLLLLCATLPFSLYFFVVFLPYTPLSILAVIALGTGFLVLSPVVLFVLHLHLLNQARRNLQLSVRGWRTTAACIACFLLLPGFFVARALADKAALHAALDYVYAPSIESGANRYTSSRINLRRALDNHRKYKNGIFYPLLSNFYSWAVFDNLVLPDDNLAALESAFFGEHGGKERIDPAKSSWASNGRSSVRERTHMPRRNDLPHTVVVRALETAAHPVDEGTLRTTFKITLENTGAAPAEYVQTLPLPAGVFVSGFRLHIDGVPVPGRIVEKKTALWVYTMIRDGERRDPGLLVFNRPDELELRVFPVGHEKPSVVEIDFLAPKKAPFAPTTAVRSNDPADALRSLGQDTPPSLVATERGLTVFAPQHALPLPAVPREAYFHFILDRSTEGASAESLAPAIEAVLASFPGVRFGRLSLANYDVAEPFAKLTPLADLSRVSTGELDRTLPLSGGFMLDRAIALAVKTHRDFDLVEAKTNLPPPRPIFVVISNRDLSSAAPLDLANAWAHLVPHLEVYQFSRAQHSVSRLFPDTSTADAPLLRCGKAVRPLTGDAPLVFPNHGANSPIEYFDPATSAWRSLDGLVKTSVTGVWAQAVALDCDRRSYAESPGDARPSWRELVKTSRETGILIPETSYIVVENAAQWRMLELSERRKLGQNAALAFRETPAPPWVWVAAGFCAWLGLRRWRAGRRSRQLPSAALRSVPHSL